MKCKLSQCKYYAPNSKYGDVCKISYQELGVNGDYECKSLFFLEQDELRYKKYIEIINEKREYVLKMSSD